MMMAGPVYLTASPCQSFGLIFNEIEYDGQRWLEIIAEIDHTCCSFMKVAVGDVAVTFNGKSVRAADELTGIDLTKERAINTHKRQNYEITFPPADRRNVAEIDRSSDERRFEYKDMDVEVERDDNDDDNYDDDDEDDDDKDDEEDSESDENIGSDEEDIISSIEKFIRNFHNGDYNKELDDKLIHDRSVIPLARPTQASYNKPDNWVERNRIGLEKVKEQLETCTYDLIESVSHYKSFEFELTHNGQRMDNEAPIVWHEPILDEYWDQLEEEIYRRNEQEIVTDILDIQISNVEIKKERLAVLVAILSSGRANSSSTYIQINNANLCGKGIVWLSKLVEVSSQLQTLLINHNRIDNLHSACCLSRSLKFHACINHLDLSHCDLGSTPEMLSVILQSDVEHIYLDNNNIDSLGAVKIAEYLESDPPIEHLSLDHNRLNDDDAILISQAMKRNTNLVSLYLDSNNFTSIGVKALLMCIFDSSSLNAISESNHTLTRIIFFTDTRSYTHIHKNDLVGCINRMFDLDKTQKLLIAMQMYQWN